MADFKDKADGFDGPIQLPRNAEEGEAWLKSNKDWWEAHPMRYDFSEKLHSSEFTPEFYQEIDRRFFRASAEFAPYKSLPFEAIIDYPFIQNKAVLEIGVGNGSHAQLLAQNCKYFAGIDLTEYACKSTAKRMEINNLTNASIYQMNAENLKFPDNSFDYVWSWGVIHHSADTKRILQEIRRVLKPEGRATIMVYYRSFWYYYIYSGLIHGILKGYLFKEKSLHKVAQRAMDGAIARFYRIPEWTRLCKATGLNAGRNRVAGTKSLLVILPAGKLKNFLMSLIPDFISRFFTSTCRMGYFLISDIRKL